MGANAFHHFQVTVTDLEKSRAFYGGFLGLPELRRPEFAFPGAWFQLAGGQELHIGGITSRAVLEAKGFADI